MRALHLHTKGDLPFSFPKNPPNALALTYSETGFPKPQLPRDQGEGTGIDPTHRIRVLTTALTRGELGWSETLATERWHEGVGAVPGHDVVGVIDDGTSSGSSARTFEPGVKVWGLLAFERDGAAAEITIGRASELARVPVRPGGIDERAWDEGLATVPLSGLTAWQALFVHGGLVPPGAEGAEGANVGKSVLVTGAAGTVGTLAVQLVKAAGCYVVAVCGRRNIEFVKEQLGADEALGYDVEGFRGLWEGPMGKGADLVIDTVGGEVLQNILVKDGAVKDSGMVVGVAHPLKAFGGEEKGVIDYRIKERGLRYRFFIVEPNGQQLEQIGRLVENGSVKGFVNSVFDLQNGRNAMEKVETRGAVKMGKVVLRVS